MTVTDSLKVAMLGGGVVGSQVARLMAENADDLAARAGARLELVGVAVRDASRPRDGIDGALLTDDPAALVARDDVDIVIEVMGGLEPTADLLLAAMSHGSSVVSANKALIATEGPMLHAAAENNSVDLYYEAAVAGAIPLLRPLRESLVGDRVRRVLGIVNGTTNYILTKMDEEGAAYDDVLAEAQRLGYAEADPTADVEGLDAAAKAAILAGLAFHSSVSLDQVSCEGISRLSQDDIAAAREAGFVVKLLAVAELVGDADGEGPEAGIVVRVHPAMVPRSHPLASVRDAYNAVFVEAEAAGQVMFYGRGAGGEPTASAILGDVVAVARNRLAGRPGPGRSDYAGLTVLPLGRATTRYAVSLVVHDRPGALAAVAQVFADGGVSLQSVRQEGGLEEGVPDAGLVVRTHLANEADLRAVVERLRALDEVKEIAGVIRVEGGPDL
ncbi:MAG: homoserine dehydrogenase [Actinobacteria bacterium]|nr:homoserine dehydrogenase [Actinomycetota bacterium]MCB9413547.1 homoserine dehydrogenase [Actinomycetota bacterium]